MTYEDLLFDLVSSDERYIIMTAENRAAIRGLPQRIGNRFLDVGIAEQTMVGVATGLALRGRIPITHALATFLTLRAFEFIRTDVGISGLPVKLVGAVPGFLSDGNGPTHQAVEDISLMRGIPPVGIFCPADEQDMLIGLHDVLAAPSPFYIRYNNLKPAVEHSTDFRIGQAEIVREGEDCAILTYGMLLREAVGAADLLAQQGIHTRVVNLRTLKPIDEAAILDAVRQTPLVITLEDHFQIGGLYSITAELLLASGVTGNVIPKALNNRWFKPGLLPDVLHHEEFTAAHIAEFIKNKLP